MKVLVLSHMYPSSFNEVAGIFVHEQVKALIKKGVEVRVISPIPWTPFPINHIKGKWRKYSQIPSHKVWDGVEVFYPRYLDFPGAWFFASSGKRMYRGVAELVKNIYQEFPFDILHAHVALPDGFAGMKIAQKYKRPLIVSIHGQDFQQTIFKNDKCKKNVEKTINFSEKTIVVSEKLKRIGENNLQISSNKIKVVSNGINKNDIHIKANRNFQKYRGKKIILSVSHLIKTKGIDLNIKAVAKLKQKYSNIIYFIIGKGEEKKKLEKLINELNLKNMVAFLGEISHHKVMEYMAFCDIFSLPSWNEGFGVVYLEAMAQGKPVIGCQGEGIEDFVEDGKTGLLVKPKDVDSLVEALDYLLSNSDKAKAIGECARKVVVENYTWEKNAEKTIKIYREVLNNAH